MVITKCYSFGFGHHDPIDGSSQAYTYARVTAPTEDMCRSAMLQVFGNRWAFEYGENIEEIWPKGDRITQKYHIFWNADRAEVGIPITKLPTRLPVHFEDNDDETSLEQARQTILDPDDDPIFGDMPPWRRVDTVELPKEDIR